jgi:uncharacterized C2H2 Zn-finger protein
VNTVVFSNVLVTETCCQCGVLFAMPEDLQRALRKEHARSFYCPNGHSQHYIGKTEAQKQRERAERLKAQLTHTRDQLETAENRRRAEKAAKTRVLNRVKNGVCPHCKRTFKDLADHMKTKHAEVDVHAEAH